MVCLQLYSSGPSGEARQNLGRLLRHHRSLLVSLLRIVHTVSKVVNDGLVFATLAFILPYVGILLLLRHSYVDTTVSFLGLWSWR